MKYRATIFVVLSAAWMVALCVRLVVLQVIQFEGFVELAANQQTRLVDVPAKLRAPSRSVETIASPKSVMRT